MSPFSHPGQVDISADVDFTALADAALAASPGVEVHGPVEQGGWLERMGIRERSEMICNAVGTAGAKQAGKKAENEKQQQERTKRIRHAINRLVERGGGGMGRIYKVLAIVPENGGRRRPVGFGGDVVE